MLLSDKCRNVCIMVLDDLVLFVLFLRSRLSSSGLGWVNSLQKIMKESENAHYLLAILFHEYF